ncbi:MAG: LPS export ABC transporter permease LptG [Rubrivivax sp.]
MKTLRRLLYREILGSVAFVALAFLSLFLFIDLVEELGRMAQRGRTLAQVLEAVALQLPGHIYELTPLAVLIGTIYVLARMAQTSEFTVLRTAGLAPARMLALLAGVGASFTVFTFVVGDFVAPRTERAATLLEARSGSGLTLGRTGAWLKERRSDPAGERTVSVNVAAAESGGRLQGVRIFEFDADSRLVRRIQAARAVVGDDGVWTLEQAQESLWPASDGEAVRSIGHSTLAWPSTLGAAVVAAAVLPPRTMNALDLWRYSRHLSTQEQASQLYQIQFWKRAFYPLACFVMIALALPFAYLHARAGGVSLKVFGGIMLGISFVLVNNVFGHLGILREWTPWVAAALPSLLYLGLSLGAFAWLVRYR